MGLDAPQTARLVRELRMRGKNVPETIYTNEHFIEWFKGARRAGSDV